MSGYLIVVIIMLIMFVGLLIRLMQEPVESPPARLSQPELPISRSVENEDDVAELTPATAPEPSLLVRETVAPFVKEESAAAPAIDELPLDHTVAADVVPNESLPEPKVEAESAPQPFEASPADPPVVSAEVPAEDASQDDQPVGPSSESD